MNPIKYRIDGDVTTFIYSLSDFKRWYSGGKEHGDTGAILKSRQGNFSTYLCFGTIENPCKEIQNITMEHCEALDGKELTNDEIIAPIDLTKDSPCLSSHSLMVVDFSNGGTKIIG